MKLNTFFDFCSGIGGGRLGLEEAGLISVGYSDTSKLSDTTYKLMHDIKNEINFGNLKNIKCETLPDFDLLIAGFPCQTFSVIGRQEGFSDDRGQIIFHLARIIKEKKPKAFILENVRGLVTHDNGKTLEIIMNLLSKCGYIVSYLFARAEKELGLLCAAPTVFSPKLLLSLLLDVISGCSPLPASCVRVFRPPSP